MDATKTGKLTLSDEELAGLAWIKANFSNHNGACVEIASTPGKVAIRDSKDPGGPILVYTPLEFRAFLDGARNGEFDSLLQLSSGITGSCRARGAARGVNVRLTAMFLRESQVGECQLPDSGDGGDRVVVSERFSVPGSRQPR